MWRYHARRKRAQLILGAISALVLVGAGSPFKKREQPLKVEETVTNLASIYASNRDSMRVEGVGLVVGLDNTGAEPPPSWYREQLVEEMQKAGVEHPDRLLTSPSVSIVIVRLSIPTGTTKTDRLDVELELPPACGTTSLEGGVLLECRLREVAMAGGTPRGGPEMAIARGPIMIGTEAKPNDPKVGRVLGGARVRKDTPYRLEIKENRRSFKSAQLLENVVNRRFHQTEGVKQHGMATAKTDGFLELRVPQVYKHNPYRYFRVIKLLPVVSNPQLNQLRMAAWSEELLDPTKAGIAALRLEGLGATAIEGLKRGLASPNDQVKFFAAEALAYLNDASGVEVLGATAIKNPDFRGVALAALSATDQSAARMKLISLMNEPEVSVRYGAFDALRRMDETDPFLGRVQVLESPPEESDEGESMAVAIRSASRSRPKLRDPFALYLVDSDGPPLIHLSRTKRSEVVVFGRSQRMLTPIVLGTGPILLNAADGDQSLQISKIMTGASDEPDAKVQSSLDIGDVIRRTANLGAKYPELVSILQAAARQKNLPGPLIVDAVPGATIEYEKAAIYGVDLTKKDSEVSKTSAETAPKRLRFFGLFSGRSSKKDKEKEKAKAKAKEQEDAKATEAPGAETSDDATTKASTSGNDPSKAADAAGETAKTDDSVTKSALQPTEKRSFFDRFRRR